MEIDDNKTNDNLASVSRELFDWIVEVGRWNALSSGVASYSRSYGNFKRLYNIIAYLTEEVKKNTDKIRIADIGCNQGYLIFLLNEKINSKGNIFFHGIDISPMHIAIAKSIKKAIGSTNVVFDVGDAENVNLQTHSFDIIFSSELIEHLENPEKFLAEIKRILKPGGTAIITTPNGSNAVMRFKKILHIPSSDSNDADRYNPTSGKGHISVKSLIEWKRLIRQAGFNIEKIRRGSLHLGSYKYDRHPILCSMLLMLDVALDCLPFTQNITENIAFKIKAPLHSK
ncbi:MAG: class I SAM-dependent methyltransferase [Candidatus Omnitrophica bacterium]|nr:class I SAM-dependent methyltransferase [Candidatus Omnitrophota bacterium]